MNNTNLNEIINIIRYNVVPKDVTIRIDLESLYFELSQDVFERLGNSNIEYIFKTCIFEEKGDNITIIVNI